MKNFILGVVCCVLLAAAGDVIVTKHLGAQAIMISNDTKDSITITPSGIEIKTDKATWYLVLDDKQMYLFRDGDIIETWGAK